MKIRHSAVRLLADHFFRRFFDNDTIQVEGDTQTTVARAIAIVASPGLMVAFFLQNAYPARTLWYRVEDHYMFILMTYVVMGIAAVLEWEMLFPDRLDFLVLTPLPLRRGTMLAGKALALSGFLALFLVGSSALGDLMLPLVSKSTVAIQIRAQVVAVGLAGIFAASSFLALAGILLCLLGTARFRAVAPVMQALAIATFVLLGIHFLAYGSSLPGLLTPPLHVARRVPPLWFVGLYERMYRGAAAPPFAAEMSRMALRGTACAVALAVVTYPVAWARMHRFAMEGDTRRQGAPSSRLQRPVGWIVPRQGERAVFEFIGKTIARNSRYQVYLAVYCGAALALAIACGVVVRTGPGGVRAAISEWGLHAVLPLLVFWTIAGLRVAFGIPANLQAGWIFGVTGVDLAACAAAARKWAVMCASVILVLVLALLAGVGWSAHQLAVQLGCGSALAILLADVFFASATRVPFNSVRLPGRVSFPLMLSLYVGVLPVMLDGIMRLELRLEQSFTELALLLFGAAAVHLLLAGLRESRGGASEDEAEYDGEFLLLGLS